MKLNFKRIFCVLLLVLATTIVVNAQQSNQPDPARMIKFHGDMIASLAQVAQVYNVTVGFEADPDKPRPELTLDLVDVFSFNLHGITLRQALSAIATASGSRFWLFRTYPDGTYLVSTSLR
jgi:hypothetical protein